MRIAVTVDTEADAQWEHGRPLATANVASWPVFQALCERYGVRPTFLITSEIAQDPQAVSFLRPRATAGELEVGAHLHPWTTPPFAEGPGLRENDDVHAFPCELPPALLQAKLETLTAQVAAVTGAPPRSFRAGRFGLDTSGARLLAGHGYVVDSSVTPHVSWNDHGGLSGRGGPDFRHHDVHPFRVVGTGTPGLVELPVTIMPTYALTRWSPWVLAHWRARPRRVHGRGQRFLPRPQPLWLRPRPEYVLGDLRALLLQAERVRLSWAVFMFHSSELLAGASPYRQSQADIDELLSLLDDLFALVLSRGHHFVTLADAGRALADSSLPVKEL